MEQIIVTPVTPAEFILGTTIPFALIGFVDVILVTLIGVALYGIVLGLERIFVVRDARVQ